MLRLQVHISLRHLFATTLVSSLLCVASSVSTVQSYPASLALGGNKPETIVAEASREVRKIRAEQFIRRNREDILRRQLLGLEQEKNRLSGHLGAKLERAYLQSTSELLTLLKDSKAAEAELLSSLNQIWESQGYMKNLASGQLRSNIQLEWPVTVDYGISATFSDAAYKRRFGFEHGAIDIPIAQGSIVRAAESGVVTRISDNGYGYSTLTIDHGGIATLYGHISEFLVSEGDFVVKGTAIAKSGGLPGSKGAGRITTGPHVHFEVWQDGEKKDPMTFLPTLSNS